MSMRVWVLVAVVLIAGCSTGGFQPTGGEPDYPPYRGEVQLLDRLPPPGAYQRLGIVSAAGGEYTSRATLLRRLRREAAARGADTIVLQRPKGNSDMYAAHHPRVAAWALRRKR